MKTRNRKDHILPQGYLRGFISPARKGLPKPLWVFDVKNRVWSERSTKQVAWGEGFYDYSSEGKPDATADKAFEELENRFPTVRSQILAEGFSSWKKHMDFLLQFGQMLRARSPLFRKQHNAWAGNAVAKLSPQDPQRANELSKNWAITDMRTEIKKGAARLSNFDWVMRFTTDPKDPVITSDSPVIAEGEAPDLRSALDNDPQTLIYLPLCWQMCMIGHRRQDIAETSEFPADGLQHFRALCAKYADQLLVSPTRQRIVDANPRVHTE